MVTDLSDELRQQVASGIGWLEQLVFGEFDEDRPLSVLVVDMSLGFVPGVVIVLSARDLTALIVRLAKHPEKRDQVEEWMLLVACALPLIVPVVAAAAGATVGQVGVVIGGIAGSEAAAVLRAVCLMLIHQGAPVLAETVGFLRKFVKGDILQVLRDIRFAEYQQRLTQSLQAFIAKLIGALRRVREQLLRLPPFRSLSDVLSRIQRLEDAFYAVQYQLVAHLAEAFAELLRRWAPVLEQSLPSRPRLATSGIPAPIVVMMEREPGWPKRGGEPGRGGGPKHESKAPAEANRAGTERAAGGDERARDYFDHVANLHPETPKFRSRTVMGLDGTPHTFTAHDSRRVWFYRPSVRASYGMKVGEGATTPLGDITLGVRPAGPHTVAEDLALIQRAYFRAQGSQFFTPTFLPFREFRLQVKAAAKDVSLIKYLEQALVESAAEYRMHGITRGLWDSMQFPFRHGYVTYKAVLTQAAGVAVGAVTVEGLTYWVYETMADDDAPPAEAAPSPRRYKIISTRG